jgi:hypothetical protein
MKCEEFITNHETGSVISRLRAKAHARHCPKCAQAQKRLADMRGALAVPADLTPYHRRVWERAAAEAAVEPAAAWSWLTGPRLAMAGGLAVAAAVIVAVVLSVPDTNVPESGKIARPTDPPSGVVPVRIMPEELAQLESGLNQVAHDLEQLAQEAELLEARRAISELAALYPPLGAGDSS